MSCGNQTHRRGFQFRKQQKSPAGVLPGFSLILLRYRCGGAVGVVVDGSVGLGVADGSLLGSMVDGLLGSVGSDVVVLLELFVLGSGVDVDDGEDVDGVVVVDCGSAGDEPAGDDCASATPGMTRAAAAIRVKDFMGNAPVFSRYPTNPVCA